MALPICALAAEGFHISEVPAAVQNCWDRAVSMEGSGAIVEATLVNEDTVDVFILTAYHIFDVKKKLMGATKLDPKSMISIDFDRRDQDCRGKCKGGESTWESLAWGVDEVYPDAANEIALMKVRISREKYGDFEKIKSRLKTIPPIEMANCEGLKAGDPVYAIGFPEVSLRPPRLQKVKIAEWNVKQKRWSTGVFLNQQMLPEYMHNYSKRPNYMEKFTYDVIAGLSGGPICDSRGRLVGVNSGGGYADTSAHRGLSVSPSCREVRKLLNAHLSK